MNDKVYIHELIDVIGHNRARYMHHMTANWCPVARDERNQLCFGVWGTVGSTGTWPQVVNLWELDGWDGLVRNFEHELSHATLQDPSLAEWWAAAASLRRGGVDRIVVPEPWTQPIEELTAAGVRGEIYAHELVTLPPGGAPAYLRAVHEQGLPAYEALGLEAVGAFRVAMVDDTEALLIWAVPDWPTWAAFEQAWLADPGSEDADPGAEGGARSEGGARGGTGLGAPIGAHREDAGALATWRRTSRALGAAGRRTLLVDAPLSPLRTGRQPQIEDRRPLDAL